MGRQSARENQLKLQIAETAARVMSESGLRDYQMAKQKAASMLGIQERKYWPSNQEIERALSDYQRLFEADEQQNRVLVYRQAAVSAMNFLAQFKPRLVGSILSGTATRHANIELHLFSDYPEKVNLFLIDSKVPFEESDKRLRISADQHDKFPVCKFIAKEMNVELTVFPFDGLRQAPLSAVDGKPMARASLSELEQLISSD